MTLGIMQPYFFPYVGYFELIARTDRWVLFDVVKYHPRSWMNRNRILHPRDGWQYVTVPVDRRSHGDAIKDVRVADPTGSRRRILGQLEHYRAGGAPHFAAVRDLVDRCFGALTSDRLAELNRLSLALTCTYLGIPFDAVDLSSAGLALPEITKPGEWALEISVALGADAYLNPPNGRDIFDPAAFAARGIRLQFTELADFRYVCGPYGFVERLSILDVLMWNAPGTVRDYLASRAAL